MSDLSAKEAKECVTCIPNEVRCGKGVELLGSANSVAVLALHRIIMVA